MADWTVTSNRHQCHPCRYCTVGLSFSCYLLGTLRLTMRRFAPQHLGGHNAAVRHSEECAVRARNLLDIDDPTIENVQVLLLLSNAFFQAGKGKKSYMLLSQ